MYNYYTAICIMIWLMLLVLCILIRENGRIAEKKKRLFYLTYLLIALAALAEWVGLQLNGREDLPKAALQVVKCADYILTPTATGALVMQMHRNSRKSWLLTGVLAGLLAVNAVFQIISAFFGLTVVIDSHHVYSKGPLYPAYLALCMIVILMVITVFFLYGRLFRRRNRFSLYAILLLVLVGFMIQEALPGGYRVAYLSMTMGAALLYIHISEFSQQETDDTVSRQQAQIETDALTGLYSRLAYSNELQRRDGAGRLPDGFAAVMLDIDGLKFVNDSLGHEAGDELIVGAAACIKQVFDGLGRCFRTGGDEFVVLGEMSRGQAADALRRLETACAAWTGRLVGQLHLSAGFALAEDHAGLSAEALVKEADQAMYEAKAAYYARSGKDRRARSRGEAGV